MEYIFALLIGLSLGLLGGGGSILTVPVLIYAVGFEAKQAIAISLAVVGVTSLLGVFGYHRKKLINYKIALIFGPMAMLGTFLGAKLSVYFSADVQMLLFSILMLAASYFIIKPQKIKPDSSEEKALNYPLIFSEGLGVGVLTGLVGVGGGFMIVPALVLLAGIEMKVAIGTSLLIIGLKSLSGFVGYLGVVDIPYQFVAVFTAFSVAGVFVGNFLNSKLSAEKLKKYFGYFLILMGIFVIYKTYFS